METTEQAIAGVLEGTIEALVRFDLEQLLSLEGQMLRLEGSGVAIQPVPYLLEKQATLRHTLEETRLNLDALERLCSRKERERWER